MTLRADRHATVVFVVALLIRLIHTWQLRRSPFADVLMGDAHAYDQWARRIAAGEWVGREVFYQAPLYPYFLGAIYASVGENLGVVRLVQAVVGAGSCALLTLAGGRFFSPRTGLVAGLALATYATAIFFDGLIQKSVLDVFFISLALWLISRVVDAPARRGPWLALGLCMGALSLTRENALVFIVVILGWCMVGPEADTRSAPKVRTRSPAASGLRRTLGDRISSAAAVVLGLAIVLLPVAFRNYAVGGGFYLTTSQFGPNFYIGNNPSADGTYMSLRFGRGSPEYERVDATELAEHALGRALTPAEVSTYWTDRALDFITGNPGAWVKLMARKFLLLWNSSEMLDTESQASYAEWSWPLRIGGWFGHFGVLVPLALLGALLAWPERRPIAVLYAMTIAYAVSVLMFYVFARYRLPLVPLLMLFAGVAILRILDWIGAVLDEPGGHQARGDRVTRGLPLSPVALLIVAAAIVFTNWPVLSKTLMRAITENNLATALHAAGRTDAAMAHYRRAIAIQPDYAPAYNNLGVVLRSVGAVDEAINTYHRALAARQDYPDAHYNLANALLEKNRPDEAAEHFQIALQYIPDSAGARNNLGIALAAGGRQEDAIAAFRAAVNADPESATAHRNLGDSLTTAGQIAEGIAELKRAIALDPNDPAAHYNLGTVLLETGRLDEAIAAFRATIRLSPRSVEAHNNLGIALGSQGKPDAAVAQFQEALRIDPAFADARRNLALATEARDRAPAARR
jgi:tetratricopeptide (TPR) repeat protein